MAPRIKRMGKTPVQKEVMMVSDGGKIDNFHIRRFTRGDVDEIVKLWVELAEEHRRLDNRYRPNQQAAERYRMFMLEGLYQPDRVVFVAGDSEKIAGFINGRVTGPSAIFNERLEGVIQDLYVHPPFRRKKLGSRLLEELLKEFKEMRVTNVLLDVSSLNRGAQMFWRSRGFTDFRLTLEMTFGDVPGE